jgi:hypothetical protein
VAKKSAKFRETNFRSHIYSTLKKKFEIFFLQNVVNKHSLHNQKKNFEKIYFKHHKIATIDDRSNLFARSNIFAPTVQCNKNTVPGKA